MPVSKAREDLDSRSYWFTESSLKESLRPGECLVCSNLERSERHSIYCFLWEGMMSPHARSAFLGGKGFCARHFWIAKRIEDESWPAGGIGVAILCENLIEHAIGSLPSHEKHGGAGSQGFLRGRHEPRVLPPGSGCIFCLAQTEREESMLEALQYLKHKAAWARNLESSPLCFGHSMLAFHIWKDPADREQLRGVLVEHLRELQESLKEFIRKHDWNHRDEPLGSEKDSVFRAIQVLTGLERQFPFQGTGTEGGGTDDTRKR